MVTFLETQYEMALQRKETKEVLDDLTTRNQRMMLSVINMEVTADIKEQSDSLTESLRSIARNRMCQIAPLTFQQMDGLNTVLPIGPGRSTPSVPSPPNRWQYSCPSRSRRSRKKAACTLVRMPFPEIFCFATSRIYRTTQPLYLVFPAPVSPSSPRSRSSC